MCIIHHFVWFVILQVYLYSVVSSQYLYRYIGNHPRGHSGQVAKRKISIREGRVRLVGGSSQAEGNVEIYHLGRWGSICDDEWDEKEASIICSSLGYSKLMAIPTSNSQFGKGRKLIWMDNLYCNGSEIRIDQCQFDGWKNHDCVSTEAAGVICKTKEQVENHYNQIVHKDHHADPIPESQVEVIILPQLDFLRHHQFQAHQISKIRLAGGRTSHEGRVEVSMVNDTSHNWYAICGNGWSLLEAMVVCRSLNLGYGQFASIGEFASDQNLSVIYPINCKGYELNLNQCKIRLNHVSTTCGQSNIAGVMCTKELPDLAPDEKEFGSSVYLEDRPLALLQCAMEENCLASDAYTIDRRGTEWLFETRRLLRFTARIGNIGTADFIPFLPKQEWEWHSCHRHYHSMEVFAHFDLLNLDGKRIAEGHKASFCLEDNNCSPGSKVKYSCKNMGNQGISVGCVDTYLANIDCQWIDITHLNQGMYQIKLTINPEFKVSELSFDNNAALCYLYYDMSTTKVWNCTLTRP